VLARRTLLASALVAPWVAWAAVRLLGLDVGHPFVAAVTFTPYVAVTAWLPVVAALGLRRRGVALVGVAAASILAAAVLPRALGESRMPARRILRTAGLGHTLRVRWHYRA